MSITGRLNRVPIVVVELRAVRPSPVAMLLMESDPGIAIRSEIYRVDFGNKSKDYLSLRILVRRRCGSTLDRRRFFDTNL